LNILITAAATAQAYQLQRLLNTHDSIFLADCEELPQVALRGKKFIKIPSGNSPSFAHLLLTVCLDNCIEKVYPLRSAEVLALAEARQLFDEYGIKLMVPDKSEISPLLDKGLKGKIIIKDDAGQDEFPDRGVFLKDDLSSEFQLFTVN
jgi:hypothetical protein